MMLCIPCFIAAGNINSRQLMSCNALTVVAYSNFTMTIVYAFIVMPILGEDLSIISRLTPLDWIL